MPKRKTSSIDTSLGKNLAFYRKMAGLTQQQVADALNLNRTTYTKYETGASEPGIEMLKRIAVVLDTDISLLFAEDEECTAVSDSADEMFALSSEERVLLRRYSSLDREDKIEISRLLDKLEGKN